jgi:serine/threonine protein kinase
MVGPVPHADVAVALVDLAGKVVHRDLKPENVLLLNGTWCLADFGISRYAEATTAPENCYLVRCPLRARNCKTFESSTYTVVRRT